jgi:hypothetical protein
MKAAEATSPLAGDGGAAKPRRMRGSVCKRSLRHDSVSACQITRPRHAPAADRRRARALAFAARPAPRSNQMASPSPARPLHRRFCLLRASRGRRVRRIATRGKRARRGARRLARRARLCGLTILESCGIEGAIDSDRHDPRPLQAAVVTAPQFPSPLAGEGLGVRGRGEAAPRGADPSSGPSGHLLPQGEKGRLAAVR